MSLFPVNIIFNLINIEYTARTSTDFEGTIKQTRPD